MAERRKGALDLDVLDGVFPARSEKRLRIVARPAGDGSSERREGGERVAFVEVPSILPGPPGPEPVATLPASPAPVARARTPRALTPVPPIPALEPVATLPASPAPVARAQAPGPVAAAELANAAGPAAIPERSSAPDPIMLPARGPAPLVPSADSAAPARSRRWIGYAVLLVGAAAAALIVAVRLARTPSEPAGQPPPAAEPAAVATAPDPAIARPVSERAPDRDAPETAASTTAPAGDEAAADSPGASAETPDAHGEPAVLAALPAAFARGGRSVKDSAGPALDALARAVAGCEHTIVLTGHTCACGDAEINRALGLTRAGDVADALVARGVARDRIQTRTAGEEAPAEPGNTSAAHAHNRRVVATCE